MVARWVGGRAISVTDQKDSFFFLFGFFGVAFFLISPNLKLSQLVYLCEPFQSYILIPHIGKIHWKKLQFQHIESLVGFNLMDIFHMYSDNITFKSLKFPKSKIIFFMEKFYDPQTHQNLTIVLFSSELRHVSVELGWYNWYG